MKRLLSFFLCSLLLFITPDGAAETDNGFLFRVLSHGYASITGFTGSETEVIVPSEIMGHPVRFIGDGAFAGKDQILSVTLPEGITNIGESAFEGCIHLAAVSLPATLGEIGQFAFAGCLSLPGIEIPAGMTVIRNKTFAACESLQKVSLPATLKTIGGGAFAASGLESIDFPQSLREIGPDAFSACPNLVNIRIPNGVRMIGRLAFSGCVKLESVVLPAGLDSLNALFSGCSALHDAAIPKSVKSIAAKGTFDGCSQVTIKGFRGSEAENYARRQDIPFMAVEPVKRVTILLGDADFSGAVLDIGLSSGDSPIQLAAQTSPDNPWPGVVWNSSAPKVVSVSADGRVTGLKTGKVTITARAVDGSWEKAICIVTVTEPVN